MKIYMETTKIKAERTAQEISLALGKAGATAVQTKYVDGKGSSLSFMILVGDREVPFQVPIKTETIFGMLQERRAIGRKNDSAERDQEQAERIAWRVGFRWVLSQLAYAQIGMAEQAEVFLPYMLTGDNKTLYAKIKDGGLKAITDKRGG